MTLSRTVELIAGLLCIASLAGCGPFRVHHASTELFVDGSIQRTVLQPLVNAPKGAFESQHWDEITYPTEKSFDNYDGDLNQFPQRRKTPSGNNPAESFVWARKRVAFDQELPPHVEFKRAGRDGVSELRAKRVIRDFGFVTECVWEEALTEVVDLADAAMARRELVKLWGDHFERACRNYFEPECDASALVALVRTEGATSFEEFYYAYLMASIKRTPRETVDVLKPVAVKLLDAKFKQSGISGPDWNQSDVWDAESTHDAIKALVTKLLAAHIKRRDGKPFDAAPVVTAWFDSSDTPESKKRDLAWSLAESQYPGGKEALDAESQKLIARICGIHGGFLGFGATQFPFRLTVKLPGVLVESNGVQIGDREVRWQFAASEAFPLGYYMRARSLVVLEAEFPGMHRAWSVDRKKCLKLIELAEKDDELTNALRECRTNRSLYPLEKYAQSVTASDAAKRAHQVLQILRSGQRG